MKAVIGGVKVGTKIVDLCKLGDKTIEELVSKVSLAIRIFCVKMIKEHVFFFYKQFSKGKLKKGIAFPTCISVNEIAGNYSPLASDETVLTEGDIVKMLAHFSSHNFYKIPTISPLLLFFWEK